jgi:3-phosphoglycerate kinase
MKYLSSLSKKNLANQTCLLRVDFNIENADLYGYEHELTRIPLRMERVLPTIKFLIDRGARVVILSHRGRPKTQISADSQRKSALSQRRSAFTLKPFAKILSKLLKKPVQFIDFNLRKFDFLRLGNKIKNSPPGSVFLLENLRFLPDEEKNDKKFAKQLALLGDFYVNDAFSVSHRAHASVVAITQFLPSYIGLALENELKKLNQVVKNPEKPLIIIIGGAKISDKIGVIKNFSKKVNCFLTGGGVANTFLAARGLFIGKSLYDKDANAHELLNRYSRKLILPIDFVIEKDKILDIGPKTIKKYTEIIKSAKTIIWNGPMGYIEDKKFRKGTEEIIKAIMKSRAFAVIGGGETTSIMSKVKGQKSKVFISTGGGAMLEYLAGKKLPGIEALKLSA